MFSPQLFVCLMLSLLYAKIAVKSGCRKSLYLNLYRTALMNHWTRSKGSGNVPAASNVCFLPNFDLVDNKPMLQKCNQPIRWSSSGEAERHHSCVVVSSLSLFLFVVLWINLPLIMMILFVCIQKLQLLSPSLIFWMSSSRDSSPMCASLASCVRLARLVHTYTQPGGSPLRSMLFVINAQLKQSCSL